MRVVFVVSAALVAACAEPGGDGNGEDHGDALPGDLTAGSVIESKRGAADLLRPELDDRGGIRVIVKLRTPFELEPRLAPDKRMQQRRDIALAQNKASTRLALDGITRAHAFESVPYMVLEVPSQRALDALVADDDITWIEPDDLHEPSLATTKTLVGATTAHGNGFTGSGYAVAVLDTGVMTTHSYLSGRVVAEACYSTTNATYSSTSLCPGGASSSTASGSGVNCASTDSASCGHGTFVAGVAASGDGTNTGTARGANIVAMQVFSKFTSSTQCGATTPCVRSFTSDWAQGLQRVLALSQAGTPIAAVNLSLGSGMYSAACDSGGNESIIKTYVAALKSAGIATVAATGNDSYTSAIASPACISNVVSVAATTKADAIASYSNNASITNLYAPGSSITSAWIGSTTTTSTGSGTSYAAPHVAGAFATLRSAKSDMTVDEGLAALEATGTAITDSRTATTITKPRINIGSAVASLKPSAPAFSIAAGTYTSARSLTLSSGTSGATIRYTTNNTAVTSSSPVYSGAINLGLDSTTVVRAKAFKTGLTESAEVSATYVITGTVATPTFSIPGGTYTTAQTVALSTTTSGATIRCTTDGSTPTASSPTCTSVTVPLDTTRTIKAKAFKASWADSAEASATYVVTGTVATPTFSVTPGTYTSAQTVTLSTTTSTATIRCTTDGSTPTSSSPVCATVIVPVQTTRTIKAKAFRASWTDSAEASATYVITDTVATPTFSVPAGTYDAAQTVTLSTSTSGATVRCTTDGSTPTSSSPACTSVSVPLATTMTIKAKAYRASWADSAEASATYVVNGTVATPTFSVPGGTYTSAQTVALATSTPSATIRCTTDGSTPTASSPICTTVTVPLDSTRTIKAVAFRSGWTDSAEASATYIVTGTVATPTFSVTPGTYTTAQTVTVSTSTPSATVRCTTDGSAPTASSPLCTSITVPLDTTRTIKAKAYRTSWADSAEASATYVVTGTVATPAFSVTPGTYTSAQTVTLSSTTPGATIRCTTDGTPVAPTSPVCTSITVPVETTMMIRARAFKTSWADSSEASATYVVTNTVATPTFSIPAGTYTSAQTVTLATTTTGATIRCTTDGSTPTMASPACSMVIIPLETTRTIKAKAFRASFADSAEASATYVVTNTVATPAFSVTPGTYRTAQSVTLTTSTTAATVRCTTDGSTPTTSSPACTTVTVPLDTTTTIKAIATRTDWAPSSIATATYVVTGTVATPTFSVAAGTYTTAQTITLASSTASATVRCTTDGSTPTAASPACTTLTVPLDTTRTIKAIATRPDWDDSAVATATYVVTGTVATPLIAPDGGVLGIGATVTITTATAGATIRYTTDGTAPTAASPAYTAPLALPEATVTTVRAIATKADWVSSAIASATFDAAGTVATPTFTPAPGTFTTPVSVTLATTTPSATIRYTTDGSDPTSASPLYSGAITVGPEESRNLRARAFRDQWTDSAVAAGTFTVACTHVPPSLSLSPATRSGDPGELQVYSIAITNADPAGCKPQTFALVRSVPAGWESALEETSFTLAPGEGAASQLEVTPPLTALANTYELSATVTPEAGSSSTATASLELLCTQNAPTLALAPATQSSAAGTEVSYQATLTNTDLGCPATTFAIAATGPGGWTIDASTPEITLASGSSETFAVAVTSAAAATGTSTIEVTATSTRGSLTETAGYTIVPCVRAEPTLVLADASISALRAATASYSATLTNHDTACGKTTFTVTPALPEGWMTAPVEVTLGSGATAPIAIDVQSSATAAADTYAITIAGTSPNHTGISVDADVTVLPTCERGAPTLAITEPAATTSITTQHYTAQVTNTDHVDCGSSTFSLATAVPAGWTASAPSTAVAPGTTATIDLAITPPASLTESSTAITVTATNTDEPTSTAMQTVHYVLGCAQAAPEIVVDALGDRRYAVRVTSRDPATCAAVTYAVALSAPIAITPTSAELAIAPGATTTAEVEVADDAPAGTHTVTVTVARTGATVATETFTVTIESTADDPGDGGGGGGSGGCAAAGGDRTTLVFVLGVLALASRRRRVNYA